MFDKIASISEQRPHHLRVAKGYPYSSSFVFVSFLFSILLFLFIFIYFLNLIFYAWLLKHFFQSCSSTMTYKETKYIIRLMMFAVPDLGMGHRGHGPGASTNWGPPPTKKIFFDLTYCCRPSAIAKQGARGPPRTHWPWGLHIGKSGPGCSIFHSYFPNILLTAVDWIRTFPGFESSTWLIDEIATQILCSNNLAAVCIILRHECRHSGRLFHVIQRLSMTNARNSHMKCCIFAHLNANVFSSILIRKFINGMSHAHFRAIST